MFGCEKPAAGGFFFEFGCPKPFKNHYLQTGNFKKIRLRRAFLVNGYTTLRYTLIWLSSVCVGWCRSMFGDFGEIQTTLTDVFGRIMGVGEFKYPGNQ